MTAENQVITIDQAEKLHELGIEKNNSLFAYWHNPKVLEGGRVEHDGTFQLKSSDWLRAYASKVKLSAFTSAELGQALGEGFESFISLKDWCCRGKRPLICYGPTEAQARAKMLIECLESGKMTANEVNQRLSS